MAGALYGRVMRALSRRAGIRLFKFFRRELEPASRPAEGPRGVELRLLEEGDVLPLCGDPELDLRQESVRTAYARGDLCVGAFEGARIAGYCWVAFAPLRHLDDVWVRFGSDVAWTYKSLVRLSHRGKGIAPALYLYADVACLERGRSLALICVESHNGPSVAAALRAGYSPSGYAAYIRQGARLRSWCSRAAARQGVTFAPAAEA